MTRCMTRGINTLLLVLAVLKLAWASGPSASVTHDRRLTQENSTFDLSYPVWSNYTVYEGALWVGPSVLSTYGTTATSLEGCATTCNEHPQCLYYAYCSAASGCALPVESPANSCILSWDEVANRTALLQIYGPSIGYISGAYYPGGQQAVEADLARQQAAAGGGGGGATGGGGGTTDGGGGTTDGGGGTDTPGGLTPTDVVIAAPDDPVYVGFGGGERRLLQVGFVDAKEHSFFAGLNTLANETAASAEECAGLCGADAQCQFWSYCPAEAVEGCAVPNFEQALSLGGVVFDAPPEPYVFAAGHCQLSHTAADAAAGTETFISMTGDSVAFWAGKLAGAVLPPTNTTPATNGGTPSSDGIIDGTNIPIDSVPDTYYPNTVAITFDFRWNPNGGSVSCAAYDPSVASVDPWDASTWGTHTTAWGADGSSMPTEATIEAVAEDMCYIQTLAQHHLASAVYEGSEAAHAAVAAVLQYGCGETSLVNIAVVPSLTTLNDSYNQNMRQLVLYAQQLIKAANEIGIPACVTTVAANPATRALSEMYHIHTGSTPL